MNSELFNKFINLINNKIQEINHQEFDEKLHTLMEELRVYCITNKQILECYRIIRMLELEIFSLLNNSKITNADVIYVLKKILRTLCIEKEIIEYRMKYPELENNIESLPVKLQWTGSKVGLVAMMYSISKFINNGKLPMNKIAKGIEYFFDIDLGNYYDLLGQINVRQEPAKFLHVLIDNLHEHLDRINK